MAKRNNHCVLASKDLFSYWNHQSGEISSERQGDTATQNYFPPTRQAFSCSMLWKGVWSCFFFFSYVYFKVVLIHSFERWMRSRLQFYLSLSHPFLLLLSSSVILFLSYNYSPRQIGWTFSQLPSAQSPWWAFHVSALITSTFCLSKDIFALTHAYKQSKKRYRLAFICT